MSLPRRLAAEAIGTALLLATVIGSGIMGERLSGGNVAVALLANALATGAILYVLITALGPVSGAHFNPIVTLALATNREITPGAAAIYTLVQIAGGIAGVIIAHAMFDLPLIQVSQTAREGVGQWISETVATAGLLFTVLGARHRPGGASPAVALYIVAAYWFTASTSFANPAVTIARTLSDTFAGIAPLDAPMFLVAQIAGLIVALPLCLWLFRPSPDPTA